MNEHWVDTLSRALAQSTSRKQFLRAVGASALALIAGGHARLAAAGPDDEPEVAPAVGRPCRPACDIRTERCVDGRCFARGQCVPACTPASGQVCRNGRCVCPFGAPTLCNGKCVYTTFDPSNCGSCGRVCPSGQACSEGRCVACRGSGLRACPDGCKDVESDPNNCGTCGNQCPANQVCGGGRCRECPPNTVRCGGGCTPENRNNCGQCNVRCLGGEVCENKRCVCKGKRCQPDGLCCPNPRGICCPNGTCCAGAFPVCVATGCCPARHFLCPNRQTCCPAGTRCQGVFCIRQRRSAGASDGESTDRFPGQPVARRG